jgi:hypothetical protein
MTGGVRNDGKQSYLNADIELQDKDLRVLPSKRTGECININVLNNLIISFIME